MGTPLVSVVMPVYNAEKFVDAAIASIANQTLRNLELVIVDDGSTDGSADIARSWQRQDPRIKFHQMASNGGGARARNAGIELATAEFIATMDADDVSVRNRLVRQVAFLRRHPKVGAVGTAARIIDAAGQPGSTRHYPTDPAQLAWAMYFGNCVVHPSLMARRAVLAQVGAYEPEFDTAEDYRLLTRIAARTQIANLEEPLLLYRTTGVSVTSRSWPVQERLANDIVREEVSTLVGEPISEADAAALRGLSTNSFPREPARCIQLGEILVRMADAFNRQEWLSKKQRAAVAQHAGIKLWLLASLAMTKSPKAAATLTAAAVRLSPPSLIGFINKSSRALLKG